MEFIYKLIEILAGLSIFGGTYLFTWFLIYMWLVKYNRDEIYYHKSIFPFFDIKIGGEFIDDNPWGLVLILIVFLLLSAAYIQLSNYL